MTAPLPDTAPGPRPRRAWLRYGAVGVLLIVGALWWLCRRPSAPVEPGPPVSLRPVTSYVGAKVCRDCHPGEYAAYTRSGHSQTLRPAPDAPQAGRLFGQSFPDPEQPGVAWSYHRDGLDLVAVRRADEGTRRFLLEYAFGSGHRAVTFVTTTPGPDGARVGREHRLSDFRHLASPGITPGQQQGPDQVPGTEADGRNLSSRQLARCVSCHATRTSARSDHEFDPATLIPNVSCERCHGPGQSHVEAARAGRTGFAMPFGPGGWTAATQLHMCGECHRLPESSPSGSVRPDNPVLARFQPVGLSQSRCYQQSGGRLSCVTCHDPHDRPSTDRLGYDAQCLQCHQAAPQAECPVSPRTGCVGCHMPRRDAISGALFADHWIRIPDRPPTAPR